MSMRLRREEWGSGGCRAIGMHRHGIGGEKEDCEARRKRQEEAYWARHRFGKTKLSLPCRSWGALKGVQ